MDAASGRARMRSHRVVGHIGAVLPSVPVAKNIRPWRCQREWGGGSRRVPSFRLLMLTVTGVAERPPTLKSNETAPRPARAMAAR